MALTLDLPEVVEDELKRVWGEKEWHGKAVEALVLAAYREGLISRGKVGELLGMSFTEREQYLKQRDIPYNYGPKEFSEDRETTARLGRHRT